MFSGSRFLYRRLASPLHAARAGVGALWVLALIAAALVLFNPIVLCAVVASVLAAGFAAGVGREVARALRVAVIVALPIVLVNVLTSRQGLTVFARLGQLGPFGEGDLTVEALVYGAVVSLKVGLLILITQLAGLTIDPDELLRGLRRLSFRSALTASLATRMIPLLATDAQRISEAQRTRPGAGDGGIRVRVALLGAVIGGSLDRAMDVAATLELRGFALAGRPARARRPWSRHDVAFACSALAVLALALCGRLSGAAEFNAYPMLSLSAGGTTFAVCGALIVAVLLPFADRRGIEP